MHNMWALAAVWPRLALIATLLAIRFKVSTVLSEIVVGTMVANAWFMLVHLRPTDPEPVEHVATAPAERAVEHG
jgi:hypothetical protein